MDKEQFDMVNGSATAPKILVAIVTTTIEKIAMYNAAARLRGHNIVFINFKDIVDFHSPDEEKGDGVAHALDKLQEVNHSVTLLKEAREYRNALKRVCETYGVPYDAHNLSNILVATEDMSSYLDFATWHAIKLDIRDYLTPEILANAEKNLKNDRKRGILVQGPGTEIGPVLSSATVESYFKAIRKHSGGKAVDILENTAMVARPLSADWTEQPALFNKDYHYRTYTGDKREHPGRWLKMSHMYYATLDNPGQPLTHNWADYVLNSTRGQIQEALFDYALSGLLPSSAITVQQAATITRSHPFRLRALTSTPFKLKSFHRIKGRSTANEPNASPFLKVLNFAPNFVNDCDAFVFYPQFAKHDLPALQRAGYEFFSTLDEKILESVSANKPLVAINDGSIDPVMSVYRYVIDAGMSKDYDRLPEFEENPAPLLDAKAANTEGVIHKGFGLFDLVQYADPGRPVAQARLENAGNRVMLRRKAGFKPYVGKPHTLKYGPSTTNQPYRKDIFKVALFTSASSDNQILLEHNTAIGRTIADMGAGFVWGAGDRHGMGAGYDGYVAANGIWVEGYSTAPILIMETKRGGMPQCNYSEINKDIFERMAKLIEASDVVVITPGGFGTVQELLAFFILQNERPDIMKGKTAIIHNPILNGDTPYWDPVIEAFLGADALKSLKLDPNALAHRGIVMSSSLEETKAIMHDRQGEWNVRQQPVPAMAKAQTRRGHTL